MEGRLRNMFTPLTRQRWFYECRFSWWWNAE